MSTGAGDHRGGDFHVFEEFAHGHALKVLHRGIASHVGKGLIDKCLQPEETSVEDRARAAPQADGAIR